MKKEEQELLDIKFNEKKEKKGKDKRIDLLSSEGDIYLQKLKEKKEHVEETIDSKDDNIDTSSNSDNAILDYNLSTDEFDIVVDDIKDLKENNSDNPKNLNNIFEIVNNNVKEATNLFNKNI